MNTNARQKTPAKKRPTNSLPPLEHTPQPFTASNSGLAPTHFSQRAQGLLVTGTGTDIGKTLVTSALLRAIGNRGVIPYGLKAIQTGCQPDSNGRLLAPDREQYNEACPEGQHSVLWCFEPACSPHLAAKQGKMLLSACGVAEAIQQQLTALPVDAFMCIEGSGGVMVPLNEQETFLDVFARLTLPALIVCPNQLGSVNHTLLTALALKAKSISLLGFVLTTLQKPQPNNLNITIAKDNRLILETLLNIPCLGEIPWLPSLTNGKAQQHDWDKAALALAPVTQALGIQPPTRHLKEKAPSNNHGQLPSETN